MDPALLRSILAQQTAILTSMREQQTALLTSMREQQTALLTSMREQQTAMSEQQKALLTSMREQQTAMSEQQTGFLASIYEHLAELNALNNLQNKFEDEDHMEKGKGEQEVTKKDQLDESPAPWYSSPSPYYRLEIEGVVGDEDQTQGKANTLTARSPLNIKVILKKDDEKVPDDDELANVKVQLVVLDDDFHIPDRDEHNSRPWWPLKDFTDHCMHLNQNNKNVPSKKMAVHKGEFRLNAGRGAPDQGATIKDNSQKRPVKLGVMVHPDEFVKRNCPRILEGVSNSFRVKDLPRGKRPMNADNESSPRAQKSKWQSAQQLGQHAYHHSSGGQPRHEPNAWSTQNLPTAPIRSMGGIAPPQGYGADSNQGLPASAKMGIHSQGAFKSLMPDNAVGHVDPVPQNPTKGYTQNSINGILLILDDIVFRQLPAALQKYQGMNPLHENLQGLKNQLNHFGGMLQQSLPLQACVIPDISASIRLVTGDAEGLELETYLTNLATALSRSTGQAGNNGTGGRQGQAGTLQSNHLHTNSQGQIAATTGDFSSAQPQHYAPASQHQTINLFPGQDVGSRILEVNSSSVEYCQPSSQNQQFNPGTDLSLAPQTQLTSTRSTRQPGNNGTGGGQGQPGMSQSNNLHTNSQGHTTTDGFTSAQV